MIRNVLLALLMAPLLSSCWKIGRPVDYPEKVMGFQPVYSNDPSLLNISVSPSKPVKNAGKIYALGNFIFQNEVGQGLHVLDKSNPAQLKNLGFINIRGNTEISIKGNFLYANSFSDLVIIDVSNWQNPTEIKRVKDAFQGADNLRYQSYIPVPEKNTYAQCVDLTKGIHTGWTKDTVKFSECHFYNQ